MEVSMSKVLYLNAENEDALYDVAKALASTDRIKILKLLYFNSYNIGEIAERLNIPPSTAALHIRILEQANLINTEQHPGSHGSMKLCSRKNDDINICLTGSYAGGEQIYSLSMPIGAYTDCDIHPTCGLVGADRHIAKEDSPNDFFLAERLNAQMLWSSSGYVEYRFSHSAEPHNPLKQLILSFEACSEAPNYRENWKSDITIWINGKDCGTWNSPGDFGARRGKLNPDWWPNGSTQYGFLVTLIVTDSKSLINNKESSSICLSDLELDKHPYITLRIGNKPDAEFVGGFNLFGQKFGDFEQDINLSLVY